MFFFFNISGSYEPNDDECILPGNLIIEGLKDIGEATDTDNCPIGIPDFWINVLKLNPMFQSEISDEDEIILKVSSIPIILFISF